MEELEVAMTQRQKEVHVYIYSPVWSMVVNLLPLPLSLSMQEEMMVVMEKERR